MQITEAKSGGDFNRSWLFRYKVGGRDRWMGGGSVHTVSLGEAREWAREQRLLRQNDVDPIASRDEMRASKAQAEARSVTFDAAAHDYMAAHRETWRSQKHASEWATTLVQFAYPVLGRLPVAAIDTPLVLKVLKPIWASKQETASRLRGRIESVLDYAVAAKYRPEGRQPRALERLSRISSRQPDQAQDRASRRHAASGGARLRGAVAQPRWSDAAGLRVSGAHGHAQRRSVGCAVERDQLRQGVVDHPRHG